MSAKNVFDGMNNHVAELQEKGDVSCANMASLAES